MFDSLRGQMQALSKTTKQIILRATMVVLLALMLTFISLEAGWAEQRQSEPDLYSTYLDRYGKKYSPEQQHYRRFVFYQTYDDIVFSQKQLNQDFTLGLNQFSDLTEPEFQQLYTIVTEVAKAKGFQQIAQFEDNYYYDWTPFMPPVKNMRDYDGGHIFAAVASAQFEINKRQVLQYRKLNQTIEMGDNWITLSEQEVIDCCPNCTARKQPGYVYVHMIDYGLSTEQHYPYNSSISHSEPGECRTAEKRKNYRISEWHDISGCSALSDRLALSPVVVHVDARTWRNYQGGILTQCGTVRNHYALLVGRGIGFWKIRNSWGKLWGEHGHIRIKSGNTCGICTRGSYVALE